MDGNRAPWVKPVMELRESFYDGETPKSITLAEVQAVIAITDNEPQWRLAIAARENYRFRVHCRRQPRNEENDRTRLPVCGQGLRGYRLRMSSARDLQRVG